MTCEPAGNVPCRIFSIDGDTPSDVAELLLAAAAVIDKQRIQVVDLILSTSQSYMGPNGTMLTVYGEAEC